MAAVTKQIEHLKKDKSLKKVIDKVGTIKPRTETDLYYMLLRAIAGQQLSVKAAATIWERFLKLFKDGYPHPDQVLKLKDDKMRSVGLSYQKASYIKNIARFSKEETLDYKLLKNKSDEELVEYLVRIKGVGKWTVEMILMFSLNRPDVFPIGDLGIQTGMRMLYKIDTENKKELFAQMQTIAESWRPYRTLACKYIWRHKDAKPV